MGSEQSEHSPHRHITHPVIPALKPGSRCLLSTQEARPRIESGVTENRRQQPTNASHSFWHVGRSEADVHGKHLIVGIQVSIMR